MTSNTTASTETDTADRQTNDAADTTSSTASADVPFDWDVEFNRCEVFRSSILFTEVRGVDFVPDGDYAIGKCDGSGLAFFNLAGGDVVFVDKLPNGAIPKRVLYDGTLVSVSSTVETSTTDRMWTATYLNLRNGSTKTYAYPREKAPRIFDVDGWASYTFPPHEWFRNDQQIHIEDAARREGFSDYFTSGRAVLRGFDDTLVMVDLDDGPVWQTSVPGLDDMWRFSPDVLAVDTFSANQRDVFFFSIETGKQVTPPATYLDSDFDVAYQFGSRRFIWNNGFLAEVNSSDSELWSRASRSRCEFAGDLDFGMLVICGRSFSYVAS